MEAGEVASFMRRGDIISHIYSGQDHTIFRADGTACPEILKAREKGVLFDTGLSGKHFSWKVFEAARRQGVGFDIMESDVTTMSWNNCAHFNIYHLYHYISAFVQSGVSLDDIFAALITAPADLMKVDCSDNGDTCLVIRKTPCAFEVKDGMGDSVRCTDMYRPMLFVHHGKCVFFRSAERLITAPHFPQKPGVDFAAPGF